VEFPGVEQKLLSPSDEAVSTDRPRRGTARDAIGRAVASGNKPANELVRAGGESGASLSSRSVVIIGMLSVLGGTAATGDGDVITIGLLKDKCSAMSDCANKECVITTCSELHTSGSVTPGFSPSSPKIPPSDGADISPEWVETLHVGPLEFPPEIPGVGWTEISPDWLSSGLERPWAEIPAESVEISPDSVSRTTAGGVWVGNGDVWVR